MCPELCLSQGVCFDVPASKVKEIQDKWQDGKRWQLSEATELPEMSVGFGCGRGHCSFGFKGNNSLGGRRGPGGPQKQLQPVL
ncbi:nucleolar RNA helicase 2-like [Carassius auratus]|uniref:Nucleolar RNA helicase 2-like n=1 Tax=Carassius auratus TaxID=7957 RepID=A0A6P6QP20_CARAU|nr:nucleolar RNA helicase 2-like [Carassius auratus]